MFALSILALGGLLYEVYQIRCVIIEVDEGQKRLDQQVKRLERRINEIEGVAKDVKEVCTEQNDRR